MSSHPEASGPSESPNVDETAYQRRREQVRRAQRVHRDRRAAYVSALEQEVRQLRTETVALRAASDERSKIRELEREVARLRAEKAERLADAEIIEELKRLLEIHGIPLPLELRYNLRRETKAAVHLAGSSPSVQYLQVTLPGSNANLINSEGPSTLLATSGAASNELQGESSLPAQPSVVPAPVPCSSNVPVCEDGTNGSQAGVDFVLALERICLHHHKLPSSGLFKQGELGTGHLDLLSSPIMARVPESAPNPMNLPLQLDISVPSGTNWSVPAAELETLLSMSRSLPLTGEVTPVEIWQKLRSHPRFSALTQERLERLRDELIPHIMCYGFGAVIVEDLMNDILDTVLDISSEDADDS